MFLMIGMMLMHFPAHAGEVISLTIEEAVALALRDNRNILLKSEDAAKAKLKIAEARAELFPELQFSGSWSLARGLYAKDLGGTSTRATLTQYLYRGGKTIHTIRYNGYNFEVAEALLDEAKLENILNVRKAFFTLLLSNELVRLNTSIFENSRAHLESLKTRYQSGEVSESELLEAQAALEGVREEREASLNQAEASRESLRNLLYLEKDVIIEANGALNCEPREVAFDESFLRALEKRPDIRRFSLEEKAGREQAEIAKADTRPSIYASWDYYSNSRTTLSFMPGKGWNDNNAVGVTFSWPVFDGWAAKAKVEQALVEVRQAQLGREKAVKDAAAELTEAYLSLKDAIARLQATDADLALYRNNLFTAEAKYKQGEVSFLDKDDAALKYMVSAFNRMQGAYDYLIAQSAFEKAMGGV